MQKNQEAKLDILLLELKSERLRQDEKWGADHDDEHSTEDFIGFIQSYTERAINALDFAGVDAARIRFIQVAALALAVVESIDRKAVKNTKFLISDKERVAALRFCDTCDDGEGYDVPEEMMQRLAELGLVLYEGSGNYQRTAALHVLQEECSKFRAQAKMGTKASVWTTQERKRLNDAVAKVVARNQP